MKSKLLSIGTVICFLATACGSQNQEDSNSDLNSYASSCSEVYGAASWGITEKDVVFVPRNASQPTKWYMSWGDDLRTCNSAIAKCKKQNPSYTAGCKVTYKKANMAPPSSKPINPKKKPSKY